MSNKRIYLASPKMHGEELKFVKEAFDSNWLSTVGENINVCESDVAKYIGVKRALGVCNGTAALHLAVKVLGIKKGDIVLCSDMTFAATVNPVTYDNAECVFVDSERDTWNIDPLALETALNKYGNKVKAVIIVHLYGTPAKLDEIVQLCKQYNVPLIEDAAESLSATYKNRQTGSFGSVGILSFNGNKIITGTSGGMLLSNDAELIDHAKKLSTQAREDVPWYEHTEIGYNYRISNVLAGIVRGQLLHIDEHRQEKKSIYEMYQKEFKNLPVQMNPYLNYTEPNFWLSCLIVDKDAVKKVNPNMIREKLQEHNIESRPIWKPMHLQPIYKNHDYIKYSSSSVNEDIFQRGLCLPTDINMTVEEQGMVIDLIKSCFE